MRVISRRRLREFAERHPDAETPLNAWFAIMRWKKYVSPHGVRLDFPSASFLGARRTVFNIRGNRYRLVANVRYDLGTVYVREVLTHAEYDRRSLEGRL